MCDVSPCGMGMFVYVGLCLRAAVAAAAVERPELYMSARHVSCSLNKCGMFWVGGQTAGADTVTAVCMAAKIHDEVCWLQLLLLLLFASVRRADADATLSCSSRFTVQLQRMSTAEAAWPC